MPGLLLFQSRAIGTEAPDLIPITLGKPEIAIGSGGDPVGLAAGGWDRKLGEGAVGAEAPDLVATILGEPEIAIGSGGDPEQVA